MVRFDLVKDFEIKKDWPVWVLFLAGLVVGAYLYPALPDQMPSHWNIQGDIDGYTGKFSGTFGPLLLAILVYVAMLVFPSFDPRSENYARFTGAYNFLRRVIPLFFVLIQGMVVATALGYRVAVGTVMQASVSILFILMGNQLGRVKHNYFLGIRTPWTLANEDVWRRTHRFGGPVFVVAGFVGLLGTFLPTPYDFWTLMASIGGAALIPIVYSYLAFTGRT